MYHYYYTESGQWGQSEHTSLFAAIDAAAADHLSGERYPKRIETGGAAGAPRRVIADRTAILARANDIALAAELKAEQTEE